MQKTFVYLFFLCSILILSCEKETPIANENNTVIDIAVASPIIGEIISIDQGLHIDGIIEANTKMGGWRTEIYSVEDSSLVDQYTDLYQQTQYTVHHHWFPEYSEIGDYYLVVSALDIEVNIIDTKTIQFTCK